MTQPIYDEPESERTYLIEGQIPASINEMYFGMALDKLKIDYHYQYQLGIAGARGSQRIDFLVYVPPRPQACFIQGAYWHNRVTATEDQIKHAVAARYFGQGNLHDFSEEQTADLDSAIASIRKELL